ncbi:hypothetical protein HK104_007782 [Borealophlyctis nickersoniae]|nr:hypothetical protein HK104_007782 [Borealophlyctis nickersoniae]
MFGSAPDGAGVAFYRFDVKGGEEGVKRFKEVVRGRLDEVCGVDYGTVILLFVFVWAKKRFSRAPLHVPDELIAEANYAFELNALIFEEMDRLILQKRDSASSDPPSPSIPESSYEIVSSGFQGQWAILACVSLGAAVVWLRGVLNWR